ncbi:hypothetical protein GQ53DRAFT_754054 [Thozetella sp. PMI_491]|nr:hypothetical protein GQ53DRAFT_754054 [Thozetella sp. PMI_491]
MPRLRATRIVTILRALDGDTRAADVLDLAHDHESYIRLQPLVIEVARLNHDLVAPPIPRSEKDIDFFDDGLGPNVHRARWNTYRFTEKIRWYGPTTCDLWIQDTPDGINSYVCAPGGIHLQVRFRVLHTEQGTQIMEQASLQGNWFLMPFVVTTFTTAHEEMMEALLSEVARRKGLSWAEWGVHNNPIQ